MLLNEEWGEVASDSFVTLSPAKETELLAQYSYLVKRAAAHMRTQVGVLVDNDDIQQIGLVALLSSLPYRLIFAGLICAGLIGSIAHWRSLAHWLIGSLGPHWLIGSFAPFLAFFELFSSSLRTLGSQGYLTSSYLSWSLGSG